MPENRTNADEPVAQQTKTIATAIAVIIIVLLVAFSFGQSCLLKSCCLPGGETKPTASASDADMPGEAVGDSMLSAADAG